VSLAGRALRRPVSTVAVVLGFVLLGAVSLGQMPVSLLPDVTLPVLTIRTAYPGAAATEVSRFVSEPIEEAIAATPGLVDLRSVSRNAEAVTTLRFAWGTDMSTTVLQVRERLDNARTNLPERAERPTLLTSDPGERPIAVLGLTGPGDLRSIARTAIEVHSRRLEQLEGIASVAVVGDPKDEIRVDVDPEKTRALGITPLEISTAVRSANAGAPGGTVRRGQFRFALRALTEFQDVEEVARTPVGPARSGITLADIGTVRLGAADPKTMVRLDGADAVGLVIYKDAGANTVAVTESIYHAIEQLGTEFPEVRIKVVAAQAQFVTDALSNLGQEIIVGGFLSLLMIWAFLRDWRASFAIGLVIPLAVFTALTILQVAGVTINILSLGGLALGTGLMVDNAIVVTEATGRYKSEGLPDLVAAERAASELTAPLIAGTLTSILVFGPIVFVQGLAAALFRDLSLSVAITLMTSLILALTLMPVMMVRWRGARSGVRGARQPREETRPRGRVSQLGARGSALYERGMAWSMAHQHTVFLVTAGVVALTVLITLRLPREILPSVDEGVAVAELALPQGTAIEETARQAGRIEAAAKQLGSSGIYARIGVATDEEVLAGADPGTSATAQLIIPVPEGQPGSRFAEALRRAVPDLARGALTLDLAGQSEFGSLIGREGRVVRVEVSAPRMEEATRWADSVRARLSGLGSLSDVRSAFSTTQPTVEVTLERERIARYGLTVDAVANALAGGLGGVASGEFRETDRRTPITVRFAGNANEDLGTALATPVRGVPVGQLVSVREIRAPVEVVRMNQRPVSVVEAAVERGGTARASQDVARLVADLPTPPGVSWQVAGADIEQQRTTRQLVLVGLLAAALMYLVLAGEFASFATPLVVMITVPLAAVGGLLMLWATGQSVNVVSLIGIVVMIGISDNDAVVKLAAIRKFREEGHPLVEAVMLGGRQRLRPILMTSFTTVAGVLPLMFGFGGGGALYRPLAATIIGGSVTALLVTFFLLPTVYVWVERRTARRHGGKTARDPVPTGRPAVLPTEERP
jgi:HAE1 family hydrophobic/amphiphilic exporter-1